MSQYSDQITDDLGAPVIGALVYVYVSSAPGAALASLTNSLAAPIANPVITDVYGNFTFFVADGTKEIDIWSGGRRRYKQAILVGPIPAGANAANPVFTPATGAPGTSALISGTYPNLTITVPRGDPGSSGALGDGNYTDIAVSGSGAILTVRPNAIGYSKMVAASAASLVGANAAGNYSEQTPAAARTILGLGTAALSASGAFQPVDQDLTDIAALSRTRGAIIFGGASAWLQLAAGTAGQRLQTNGGSADPTFVDVVNVQSVASSATVTPTFTNDQVEITAQAAALNLANPTGTAVTKGISIRIKDNATARLITYGTQYRAIGVTLPTTTVVSKTLYLGMIWNAADTKWDVVAVAQEA